MKKNLIISIIALLLGTILGINKDLLTAPVEKIYCTIVPNDCTGGK